MQRDMGNAKIDNAAASNPVPTNIEWRDEIVAKPVLKQMRYVPAKSSCAKPACTRKIVTSRPARDTSYSVRTYKVVPANY
jgi:hypothetical protein